MKLKLLTWLFIYTLILLVILYSLVALAQEQPKLDGQIAAQDSLVVFLQQQLIKKAYDDNTAINLVLPNGKKILFRFRDEVNKLGVLQEVKVQLSDSTKQNQDKK